MDYIFRLQLNCFNLYFNEGSIVHHFHLFQIVTKQVLLFFSIGLLLGCLGLKCLGWVLDNRVERNVQKSFPQHRDSVLEGSEPFSSVTSQKTLVIFIHGFTDTPHIFDKIIRQVHWGSADYIVPLLPFHGRGLREMQDFDPIKIENYLRALITAKNKEYEHFVLVGQSLGGSILIRLAQALSWSPDRVKTLLLAPALFLRSNTKWHQLGYYSYPLFRNYLKKPHTYLKSSSKKLLHESALSYYAISAVRRLQYYCQKTEKILSQSPFPHTVLVAKEDNRVNVERLSHLVSRLPHCQLTILNQGNHLLYLEETSQEVAQRITHLIVEWDASARDVQ